MFCAIHVIIGGNKKFSIVENLDKETDIKNVFLL